MVERQRKTETIEGKGKGPESDNSETIHQTKTAPEDKWKERSEKKNKEIII